VARRLVPKARVHLGPIRRRMHPRLRWSSMQWDGVERGVDPARDERKREDERHHEFLGTLARHLQSNLPRKWEFDMLAGAIIVVLLILGMFLSMLSSSPKKDSEWHPDTEA
jgi:hypothetical protein